MCQTSGLLDLAVRRLLTLGRASHELHRGGNLQDYNKMNWLKFDHNFKIKIILKKRREIVCKTDCVNRNGLEIERRHFNSFVVLKFACNNLWSDGQ